MKLTAEQKDLLEVLQAEAIDKVYSLSEKQLPIALQLRALKLLFLHGGAEHDWPTVTGRGLWPMWAIQHFPAGDKIQEELSSWKPATWRYTLHRQVLVVAITRVEGTWKAYCGPVPGMNHHQEEGPVLETGDQLSEKIARSMFPHMEGIPYAR